MASFNHMPTEILERIFDNLDFRSRRNLTLVCQRWNAVLLSDRFIKRNVTLLLDGNRMPDPKHTPQLHRYYPNVSLQLDAPWSAESVRRFRALPSVAPYAPTCLWVHVVQMNDPRWIAVCEDRSSINLRTVESFHLLGSLLSDQKPLLLWMEQLRTMKLEMESVRCFTLCAPNLRKLYLVVHTEDHLDFLLNVVNGLHSLSIVFIEKDSFYFYTMELAHLRHLSIKRRLKGMTKSEQNSSIAFFKRCVRLERLELTVKFIDSYVLHTTAENLGQQLVELTLDVSEGTIELVHIAKLTRLERLRIAASRVNLQHVHLPRLQSLVLGSTDLPTGTYLEGIDSLMTFGRLRTLTLVNVKIYPEMLQLTPTYSVERMVLSHYRRLEETHLLLLVRRFPAIRWLRVSQCHGLYQREIDKLKRMLPKLAVAFDEAKSDRL